MELVSEEERDQFVRFARHLDDGEAQTCALAVVHRGTVATDDKKALRLLEREGVAALQTPQLLHAWANHSGADAALVTTTLRCIETLASFRPGRGLSISCSSYRPRDRNSPSLLSSNSCDGRSSSRRGR